MRAPTEYTAARHTAPRSWSKTAAPPQKEAPRILGVWGPSERSERGPRKELGGPGGAQRPPGQRSDAYDSPMPGREIQTILTYHVEGDLDTPSKAIFDEISAQVR